MARRILSPLLAGLLTLAAGIGAPATSAASPAGALRVVHTFPPAGSIANGASRLAIELSQPVVLTAPPRIQPPTPGRWWAAGGDLYFQPRGSFPPGSRVLVTVPGGRRGVRGRGGASLARRFLLRFRVGTGSLLGAEQVMATLGYLPVRFQPPAHEALGAAAAERALFVPDKGRFVFSFDAPTPLRRLWAPGKATVVLRGAIVAFQHHARLATTGDLDAATWRALWSAASHPTRSVNPYGYTYGLVDQQLPEDLTLWHDGQVVLRTAANTGIAASPTARGTFVVYLRYATQIMRGTSPSGKPYADPVAFVAYFDGSQAVHYIARATYGFPQSFGCVELPYAEAERAFGALTLGSLVTIAP